MRNFFLHQIYEAGMKLNATYSIENKNMTFLNNNKKGVLQMYDEGWFEIIVENQDHEILYYQQLDTNKSSEKDIADCLLSFYDVLYDENTNKTNPHIKKLKKYDFGDGNLRIPNLLVTCTSGASSSYYAKLIKDTLTPFSPDIKVGAIDINSLASVENQYDCILLSPQVSYKYKELKEKYGERIMCIAPTNYGTCDTTWILEGLKDE